MDGQVALAGSNVVFADGPDTIELGGGKAKLLGSGFSLSGQITPGYYDDPASHVYSLSASSSRIAWVDLAYAYDGSDGTIGQSIAKSGPLAGPFATIGGDARAVQDNPSSTRVLVAGDAVAIEDTVNASPRTGTVRVHVDGQPDKTIANGENVNLIGFAGDYIAYEDTTPDAGIQIINWKTGAPLYQVHDAFPGLTGYDNFALQADGKLAYLTGTTLYTLQAAWASAAEPTAHPVGAASNIKAFDGDKILYRAPVSQGPVGPIPAGVAALRVTDLTGHSVAVSGADTELRGDAAMSGGKLAYATGGCVYAGDIPTTDTTPAPCLRVVVSAKQIGKKHYVTLKCTGQSGKKCVSTLKIGGLDAKQHGVTVFSKKVTVAVGKTIRVAYAPTKALKKIPAAKRKHLMVVTKVAGGAANPLPWAY